MANKSELLSRAWPAHALYLRHDEAAVDPDLGQILQLGPVDLLGLPLDVLNLLLKVEDLLVLARQLKTETLSTTLTKQHL